MVSWAAVPLLKPFRALRFDVGAAGPLDDLVAPPYDVITPEGNACLLARSPWNAVRLVRPDRTATTDRTERRERRARPGPTDSPSRRRASSASVSLEEEEDEKIGLKVSIIHFRT